MERIVKDKFIVYPFLVSTVLLIVAIFVGTNLFNGANGELILNFSSSGAPILGTAKDVMSIVAVFGFVFLFNNAIAYVLYFRERFLSYILSFATPIIGTGVLILLYSISRLN